MSDGKLAPSASAVIWMFRALGEKLPKYQRKELIEMSLMNKTTFQNGVNAAVEAGLIEKRGNKYRLKAQEEKGEENRVARAKRAPTS